MSGLLASAVLLGSSAGWALDGNDTVRLVLAGGAVVEGRFLYAEPSAVVLSVPAQDDDVSVPLVIVDAVEVNGAAVGLEAFRAEAAAAWSQREALLGGLPGAPHPAAVATASVVLWSGAGHAMMRDWRAFGGYSALEGMLLGAIAVNVATENGGPLPALIGLDVLLRAFAAQESARVARRRREIQRAAEMSGAPP